MTNAGKSGQKMSNPTATNVRAELVGRIVAHAPRSESIRRRFPV